MTTVKIDEAPGDDMFKDKYTPMKCSASNRVIGAKDHAAVTIAFALLNEDGVFETKTTSIAVCGAIRRMGEADDSVTRLACAEKLIPEEYLAGNVIN